AVEERRAVARAGGRAAAGGAPVVLLDQVRVEGRIRREREDGAGAGIERDGGAALAAQRPDGRVLRARVQRQVHVVAADGDALELVDLPRGDRREVAVRAGEVVVLALLDPGPRPALRRVPEHVRRELAVRIAPEVERLPAL